MNAHTTLGELTAHHPAAAKVFHTHGLDYCCGGKQTLEDACREKNLSSDEVLAEISRENEEGSFGIRWETQPLTELIDYILTRYHAPLRDELPRLINLAGTVESVHAGNAECPNGLKDHLIAIADAVEGHLAKEEQILFPLIKSGQTQNASAPIRVMMLEHDDHGANLRKTREITNNFFLPDDACATWRELYRSLERLEKDLMDHIHLENNILFPRATEGK